jgi:putative transposase
MALKRRCPGTGLRHHSDRGSTYASEDYCAVLATHGITCSMSRRGNCDENAVMDTFFSTVTSELGGWFDSDGNAKAELFDDLEVFHTQRRRHASAGRMSPAAYERKMTDAA